MKKAVSRLLCLTLALCLLLAPGFPSAFAEDGDGAAEAAEPVCTDVRVYMDGLLAARAYRCDDGVFLPLETLCAVLGLDCTTEWDEASGLLRMHARGFDLEADAAQDWFCVNGRYLYDPVGFRMIGGRACFPSELAARIFTLGVEPAPDGESLELDLSEMAILPGGVAYYSDTYGSEELFWLARIISAEAAHQPMAGRIAVGNVVLNRVASELFPDNLHDVVFDTKFGVQFAPVYDGHVYREPDELSMVAACLCFDGWNTAGDSLFFIDPTNADDGWLRAARTFVVSIGAHDFYA